MTVIRLDAATLAKLLSGTDAIFLGDETGKPLLKCAVSPLEDLDRESDLTEEEWDAVENDPVEYTLEEAWIRIKRGETF
jgi:hypothetical protein